MRHIARADASFIAALYGAPTVIRFIGDRGVRDVDTARAYITDHIAASYAAHGFGVYLVSRDRSPVGICGIVKRASLPHPDIAFAMSPEHRGHGYTREASRAVIDHARDDLGLRELLAIVTPDNAACAHVLAQLGFSHLRDDIFPPDDERLRVFRRELQR